MVDDLDGDAAARGAREGTRDRRVERGPGGLIDVGAEGALELVVGVVGAEEVGVADVPTSQAAVDGKRMAFRTE